jgi:L-malate glycosyltransferase
MKKLKNIAFILDNFRLMHVEQIDAVAHHVRGNRRVFGFSIFSKNLMYDFDSKSERFFTRVNLFSDSERTNLSSVRFLFTLLQVTRSKNIDVYYISHYERKYIFLFSAIARMIGKKIILLNDSKFDDYPRFFWRELGKRILYLPYSGGIAASVRSADYLRFLGVRSDQIRINCYTADVERIRAAAKEKVAADEVAYANRNFLCVARLVPKKNLKMLIDAYAIYAQGRASARKLIFCGDGSQREELLEHAKALNVESGIEFLGNQPSDEIAASMARSLCLLLPSIEEQFGIVVLEALALGLPIILGENCGARDRHVRSGVNGFVVEPDNPDGLAYFMSLLSNDEALWQKMSAASLAYSDRGDTARFVESVVSFLD